MNNSGVTVGLDIGTTSIKVVITQMTGNQFNVIGAGNAPSRGLRRGVIVDIDATASAIREAIDQAQEKANIQISEVVAGVPANQIKIINVDGLVSIANQNKRITYQDVQNVATQALSRGLPADHDVIELVAEEFVVDGFDGIKDPHEMIGVRLEMHGIAYVGPEKVLDNTRMAIQKAGLTLREFVLAPLAMGSIILNDGQQDFGTVLIDLGGGQTSTSVIHDRKLKFTFVDIEGGDNVTKDISTVLGTSYINAEKIKRDYGYADPSQTVSSNEFPVEVIGEEFTKQFDEQYLSEIIAARLEQMYTRLFEQLKQIGALNLPGGFVLTGGNAALPKMVDFAKRVLGDNVRLFVPDQIGLRHPAYSRSLSYAMFASRESMTQQVIKQTIMQRHAVEQQISMLPEEYGDEVVQQPVESFQYDGEIVNDPQQGWFGKMRQKLSNLFNEE
ncbi:MULTISPECIES: cell division protein FtsA [Leuconostoc]|uniref:Cell division protein FtsA n=1 Tax=Leuconostoc suionicum TaxID=1511761 RepID=A0A2N9K7N9_9LACO|nr:MULTISPECIES: cell division protein FtsA [Leuconostoc]API72443.1 cell division protein FtsA [Leuconostoc suionicum]MBE4727382.1 cell division protein FtsA [Leuconostoc suionicum]MCT4376688.1 cell division protein FtsA [Leuconostoc suionicum]MCT4382580.1 cell division protein FtsA [Leuconostoc suionicum]MCT4403000.1 cell division protein FtsA [Leuconostoc suionicum]